MVEEMNKYQKSFIQNGSSFLMHYNKNHDKLGRFAETNGSSRLASKNEKTARKLAKEEYRKESPLNKGMSPMDYVYDAINMHDAVKKHTDDYKAAKNIFDSLSESEKKSLTSNGQYSDSEYLVTRHVSKTRDCKPMSFAEIERDPEDSKIGYLSTATKKEYRGSGFSKNAIDRALIDAKAKGIKQVYWETTKSNTASSSLAKKMGFKPTKNFSKNDDNYVYNMSNFSKDKKARDQVSWANAIIATGYGNADDIAKAERILEKERKRNNR